MDRRPSTRIRILTFARRQRSTGIPPVKAPARPRRTISMCGRPGPTVRRAPGSGCLRTRAVSSGSKWTRIRARPCPPGWFRAIRLPRRDGQNGGDVYRDNIMSCGGLPSSYAAPDTVCPTNIGNDDMAYWAERGCYATEPGNMVGPTRQGIEELIARDAGAVWGASGVTSSAFSPATSSPRVVPIGVMDIDDFLSQDPAGPTVSFGWSTFTGSSSKAWAMWTR